MSRTDLINIGDDDVYAVIYAEEGERWTCQIGEREIKLCLGLKFIDCIAAGIEYPNKRYPVVCSAVIMPIPSEFSEEAIEEIKKELGYNDEISISDILRNTDYGAPVALDCVESKMEDVEDILDMIKLEKHEYWLKSDIDYEEFIDKLVKPKLNTIFALIGFTLDRQSRPIGTTGWDEIEFFIDGNNPIDTGLNKIRDIIKANHKYCSDCGEELDADTKTYVCANCGEEFCEDCMDVDFNYCNECRKIN